MTAVRWANLSVTEPASGDSDPADPASGVAPLPLALPGAVTRTFDTPGFAGMTFYEIRAKSVINRVPAQSQVPFEWTINPYRGCSHACVYCLDGATPILMADGRTKPLADVEVGDEVYGTQVSGRYRRYVRTRVLAHWSTLKPAYRITLEDGTQLIASADHRFLTDRGWKHVVGAQHGQLRRPHLTLANELMGSGKFAPPPAVGVDYKIGYVCGMIRGSGTLGHYRYTRRAGGSSQVYRVRLALADVEALDRSAAYLNELGVPTDRFAFDTAPGRRPMTAIRSSRRSAYEAVRRLTSFPSTPGDEWQKGYLAGMFDAEGSYSRGVLRISNTNPQTGVPAESRSPAERFRGVEVIEMICLALKRFGFEYAIEDRRLENGLRSVRLRGGLPEHLRLFHTIDPAITRKRSIDGVALKSHAALGIVSIEPLRIELPMYDITTGTGDFIANGVVSHNCFARNTHTYLDLDAGADFDSKVIVKVNAGEVARRELSAPSWPGDHIAMGTNVDCYQRAEGRYRLMPQIIAALRDFANPFSILTKGTLILRDLPLLRQAAGVASVGLSFSIGFVDDTMWRSVEPGTPSPRRRLDAVRTLSDAGFAVGVLMAPILPFLTDTDESIDATVGAIAAAGATSVTPLTLHLRPGAREWYTAWLAREHPHLAARYRGLYRGGSYLPKSYTRDVSERVRRAAERHGMHRAKPGEARQVPTSPAESKALETPPPGGRRPPEPEQLTLL